MTFEAQFDHTRHRHPFFSILNSMLKRYFHVGKTIHLFAVILISDSGNRRDHLRLVHLFYELWMIEISACAFSECEKDKREVLNATCRLSSCVPSCCKRVIRWFLPANEDGRIRYWKNLTRRMLQGWVCKHQLKKESTLPIYFVHLIGIIKCYPP